jgi:hypothetical protein
VDRISSLIGAVALAAALASAASPAMAHWADLAAAELVVAGRAATLTLTIPTGLVAAADDDRDGTLSAAEITRHRAALERDLGAGIALTAGGEPGTLAVAPPPAGYEPPAVAAGGADPHATIVLGYAWPADGPPLSAVELRYGLFAAGAPEARCLVNATVGGRYQNTVLTPREPAFTAGTPAPWWEVAARFVASGVEHILFGFDHVLFLVTLLLVGGGLWAVVKLVTAFTVAHSVTLSLAVLGLVTPPGRLIEPLIALTIVYVAAENFWRKDLDGRWALAFVFGLVHGFGFAGAIADTGLPADRLALSLGAFNAGIELGQLAIVVAAMGLLSLVRGRAFEPVLRRGLSGAVVAVGLFWFVERVWGA